LQGGRGKVQKRPAINQAGKGREGGRLPPNPAFLLGRKIGANQYFPFGEKRKSARRKGREKGKDSALLVGKVTTRKGGGLPPPLNVDVLKIRKKEGDRLFPSRSREKGRQHHVPRKPGCSTLHGEVAAVYGQGGSEKFATGSKKGR